MHNFEKAFFPTEKEKMKQKEFLDDLHEERVLYFIKHGSSRQEAEEMIEEEIREFIDRGYYS